MTIAKTDARKQSAGNDSTVAFSFPYRFFADGDLQVYLLVDATGVETLQTLTTHYSVSNAGDETGGTVTMVTAPATGETLTILRSIAQTQGTDYATNDAFPAETHETALDRLTLIDQQQEEVIGRTIKVSSSSALTDINLPTPAAGKALQWDVSETGLENSTATIDTAVVDAAASAAAALVSENAAAADLVLTNADVVSTGLDVVDTNADVVSTGNDVTSTNADVVSTNADVVDAAASAAAADVAKIEWQGAWVTTTVYELNDAVEEAGSSYICIIAHTAGVFATDLGAGKWELLAQKGDVGTGSGDMLSANNLSDVGNAATSFVNIKQTATTSITGVVEKATTAEAEAGTTADKYPDVVGVKVAIAALSAPVQIITSADGEVATGTTVIPHDDSIPQNTEGDEYLSVTITPKSTTNLLVINAELRLHNTDTSTAILTAALFKNSESSAIAASAENMVIGGTVYIKFSHNLTAGATSAITFKVRGGCNNAGTTTLNGTNGARRLGGKMASRITVTEYFAS